MCSSDLKAEKLNQEIAEREEQEKLKKEQGQLKESLAKALSESSQRQKHYTVVSGKTLTELEVEVNKMMEQGYVAFGGVSAAAFGMSPVGGNKYIQAMVAFY